MGWIRCRLSFALVRCAILCICGARSRLHLPAFEIPMDVQIAEVGNLIIISIINLILCDLRILCFVLLFIFFLCGITNDDIDLM